MSTSGRRSAQGGGELSPAECGTGLVYHIVSLKFAEFLSDAQIKTACSAFTALAEKCHHPDGKRYIVAIHGGANNSPEGASGGITHAFIVIFKSIADRDYYVWKDPVHDAFKRYIGAFIAPDDSFRVVDFEDGKM